MILTRGKEFQRDDDDDDYVRDESVVDGPFFLIDLGPADGQYSLTVDLQQCVILLQSPISGQHAYHLTNDWCCVQDGHHLEGILVRDLIRQIQGVPNL